MEKILQFIQKIGKRNVILILFINDENVVFIILKIRMKDIQVP